MRLARLLMLPVLIGTIAAGCGDDDDGPSGPNVSQFQGTWNATSITYANKTTPAKSLNVVGVGGGLRMVIGADGRYTGEFKLPVGTTIQTIPITGSLTLQGTNQAAIDLVWPTPALEANPPVTDFVATYTLAGNQLTFTRPDTNFAFPPSSTAESASLVISMTRT